MLRQHCSNLANIAQEKPRINKSDNCMEQLHTTLINFTLPVKFAQVCDIKPLTTQSKLKF